MAGAQLAPTLFYRLTAKTAQHHCCTQGRSGGHLELRLRHFATPARERAGVDNGAEERQAGGLGDRGGDVDVNVSAVAPEPKVRSPK
jgi:hypothetical protein